MAPFALIIKPSKIILVAICFYHLNCLLIWWCYFSWPLVGVLFIGISLFVSLKQIHWIQSQNAIEQIWFESHKTTICRKNRARNSVTLLKNSVLSRFICILSLQQGSKIHTVCVFPNNTAPEEYRQLMAFARWHKQTEQRPKLYL